MGFPPPPPGRVFKKLVLSCWQRFKILCQFRWSSIIGWWCLSLLILSSSSFLINIILELWIAAKRKPAYVAYVTAMIVLQIILRSIVHIYDFHIFIISCVYNEPIQWPARSWLVSLIVRALHQYRRGQEFESCTSLSFFQAFLSQLHKLRI